MKGYRVIYIILLLPVLWVGAFAYAQTWQEPIQDPPLGNLYGPVWAMPTDSAAYQDGSIRLQGASVLAGVTADYALFISTNDRVLNTFALDSGDWAAWFGNPSITTDEGDGNVFAKKYCLPDGPADADTDPDCVFSWEAVAQAGELWSKEVGTNNNIYKTSLLGIVEVGGDDTPSNNLYLDGTKLAISGVDEEFGTDPGDNKGPRLYIDSNTGNPEIDLEISSSPDDHWGMYVDTTSRELRFWAKEGAGTPAGQGRNNIALTSDGVMIFAGWGPLTPAISINDASNITDKLATLSGTVNPRGDTTTTWFRLYDTVTTSCIDTVGTKISVTLSDPDATTPITFSVSTSIAATKQYWFCALAENASGLSVTDVKTFIAATNNLTVTTVGETHGVSAATLNGSFNPYGYTSEAWFKYSTIPLGGATVDETDCPVNGKDPISGVTWGIDTSPKTTSSLNTNVSFTASINITSNTTYYYCAYAANTTTPTKATGKYKSFTTGSVPTATTNAATALTTGGATLNGTFSAQGSTNVSLWFKYSSTNFTSTGCVNATTANTTNLLSTSSITYTTIVAPYPFSRSVTGLSGGTPYYYCALITVGGETYGGSVTSFTTEGVSPTVTTNLPTSLSTSGATLNGSLNTNGVASTAWFRYWLGNPGSCTDTGGTSTGSFSGSSGTVTMTQSISGLASYQLYYYCAIGQKTSDGTKVYSSLLTFYAATLPAVTTNAATSITSSAATLNGTGNPNLAPATGKFRFRNSNPGVTTCGSWTTGSYSEYTASTPVSGNLGSGNNNMAMSYIRGGLTSSTIYWYCAVACQTSTSNCSFGANQIFTTKEVITNPLF